MGFQIQVCYDTGDSDNSYPNEMDVLELVNESRLVAQSNIDRIIAHKNMHTELKTYRTKKLLKDYSHFDWFVEAKDTFTSMHSIKLKTDDGKDLQIRCTWIGYFETFNYAELIPSENTNYRQY